MNALVTVTATRATEPNQYPAFVLCGNSDGADAVGVQEPDGSWTIGKNAVTFDGIGILGIGTVIIDGKAVWFGSFERIDRNVQAADIDAAIAHAEHMWDTVDAD